MTSPGPQSLPVSRPERSALAPSVRAEVDDLLRPVDQHLARAYPGATPARQPVHTVYVPADRYRAGLARQWGQQALQLLEDAGGIAVLLEGARVSDHLTAETIE